MRWSRWRCSDTGPAAPLSAASCQLRSRRRVGVVSHIVGVACVWLAGCGAAERPAEGAVEAKPAPGAPSVQGSSGHAAPEAVDASGTQMQSARAGMPAVNSGGSSAGNGTGGAPAAANSGGAAAPSAAPGPAAGASAGVPSAGSAGAAPAAQAAAGAAGLPMIGDPAEPGPFGAQVVTTAPGLDSHMLFVPGKLGENGLKHPIIVWTNGAGGSTGFYEKLLQHFASHGFFVVADKMSGSHHDAEIVEQKAGVAWAEVEAGRAASPYFGKLDATRIAVAGHSLGSISSFATAADPRIKASIHWSAGLTGNPVGAEEAWLQGLHAPAAFFCGQAEPRALPRCSGDFDNAPANVPVFYGTLEGATHTSTYDQPRAGEWGRAGVAWFRFALAGDESFRSWFQAPTCKLCASPWMGKSRGI